MTSPGLKDTLRVLFALPGLHRVDRGAEVAFESVAAEMARLPGFEVTLVGSGEKRPDDPYEFIHVGCMRRENFEKWPRFPMLRSDCAYEDLSFFPGLLRACNPRDYDVTVTCNYPYCNWALRTRKYQGKRPTHIYVTQNGDWPAQSNDSEFRWFSCDGLVCINTDFYETNREKWPCALIPNGVDSSLFLPGDAKRDTFNLPEDKAVVLMVSALIPSKRVIEGIRSVAKVDDAHMVVAGDGPMRDEVERLGNELMGDRFQRISVPRDSMPDLYRSVDAFLHMSQIEPFGNVYIEALATGLPIVAHDRASTQWIFGDLARLIDTNDFEAVAKAIGQALEEDISNQIATRRDLIEKRFIWPKIAQQYADFFVECVERCK